MLFADETMQDETIPSPIMTRHLKNRLSTALYGLLLVTSAVGAQEPSAEMLLINVEHRRVVSLDGPWHAIVDPYETGYYDYRRRPYDASPEPSNAAFYRDHRPRDRAELVEYDFDAAPTLNVPGDWNSQNERLFYYEGTVWLRRTFDLDAKSDATGRRFFLHFGAVNYRADVYLNGVKLGVHEGGFTPFDFEVTRLVRPRGNSVVVKADNTRRRDAVPTLSTDWWNYGGITRGVSLVSEPAFFIQDYAIQLKRGASRTIAGYVRLNGAAPGERVTIAIPELGVEHEVPTNAQGLARFEFDAPALVPWSPDAPKLYEIQVRTAAQTLRDDIGFRTIETRGGQILLNGKPVYLRGISIHEENALKGARAHSEADARQALGWARELGCNYVRLAHYPHNEHMLRLADRLGLLVWEEIPVYWTIDFSNPAALANAQRQLSEVITRDRNRAASIIWSVANETPVTPERAAFLRSLIEHTRRLDPTRLVSAALETHVEGEVTVVDDPIGRHLDIVAFNEYRGWYGGSLDDAPQARWEVRYDKPVIISEFGGSALAGRHGARDERWTEEYQDYLYRQNLAMIERIPHVTGMSPWILADFRSPRRLLTGVQDGYNRKGLISNQGVKKQAFYTLRDFYRRVEARDH